MAVARKKTSLYLDEQLVQSAKLMATTSGKHDYEIVEEALREYVSAHRQTTSDSFQKIFDDIAAYQKEQGIEPLSEEEAATLAVKAVHAARARRRAAEQQKARQG